MFQADDVKYLKWFTYEALVSAILHSSLMLTFCIIWTYEDHQLFVNLNECAKNSLQYKFPYICIGIACMAISHLIFTLIYVGFFPHVWNLDPTRRCEHDMAQEVAFDTPDTVPIGMMTTETTLNDTNMMLNEQNATENVL